MTHRPMDLASRLVASPATGGEGLQYRGFGVVLQAWGLGKNGLGFVKRAGCRISGGSQKPLIALTFAMKRVCWLEVL